MSLAIVMNNGQSLHIRRLNTSYIADIKSGGGLWLAPLIIFVGLHFLSVAFNEWLRRTGSIPPGPFMPISALLPFAVMMAFGMAVYLADDFIGLFSPQTFDFDRDQNAFFANGKKIGDLDRLSLRLQDGLGPSRRAFRIVVTAGEKNYIIAQTRRITMSTLAQKEYPSVATSEGLQRKYWFHRWADYTGAIAGFSSKWPDYQEIFALYAELKIFIPALETQPSRKS